MDGDGGTYFKVVLGDVVMQVLDANSSSRGVAGESTDAYKETGVPTDQARESIDHAGVWGRGTGVLKTVKWITRSEDERTVSVVVELVMDPITAISAEARVW